MRGKARRASLTLGLRATHAARNAGLTVQVGGLSDSCREEVKPRQEDNTDWLTCVQSGAELGEVAQAGDADHGQVPQLDSLKELEDEVTEQESGNAGKLKDHNTGQDEVAGVTGCVAGPERGTAGLPRHVHKKSKEGRTHGLRYNCGVKSCTPHPA